MGSGWLDGLNERVNVYVKVSSFYRNRFRKGTSTIILITCEKGKQISYFYPWMRKKMRIFVYSNSVQRNWSSKKKMFLVGAFLILSDSDGFCCSTSWVFRLLIFVYIFSFTIFNLNTVYPPGLWDQKAGGWALPRHHHAPFSHRHRSMICLRIEKLLFCFNCPIRTVFEKTGMNER